MRKFAYLALIAMALAAILVSTGCGNSATSVKRTLEPLAPEVSSPGGVSSVPATATPAAVAPAPGQTPGSAEVEREPTGSDTAESAVQPAPAQTTDPETTTVPAPVISPNPAPAPQPGPAVTIEPVPPSTCPT